MLAAALASVALAQDAKQEKKPEEVKDPVEILKRADAACKKLRVARYEAQYKPEGWVTQFAPEVRGKVVLAGEASAIGQFEKFRIEFDAKMDGVEGRIAGIAGGDGDEYYLIDPAKKMAYVDIDPAVMGRRGQIASALGMTEYVYPTPYSDEINGESQELKGQVKVGDVACYEVHVKYAATAGGAEATWYFGVEDFLPRKVIRTMKNPEDKVGKIELTVHKLEVDPKLPDDFFKVKVPEGFEKTDDFAP
jgi:hypothetical protein